MLFTIIIPTFNSEKVIGKAINSVLNQTVKDFEILIIDCLSSDKTLSIIASFNDSHIKVYSEKDNGIYDAMNKGIKMAKGKWLFFLGSDDFLCDDNVLKDVSNAITNDSIKVIYGNVKIIGNTGWAKHGDIYDGKFNLEKILKKNIAHQSIFYHKSVFHKCGFYNINYKICADFDFNLRAFSNFRFNYIEREVAYFNSGGASTDVFDKEFSSDFSRNVVQYFMHKLYKPLFVNFELEILSQSKIHLKKIKVIKGTYLLLTGLYFKIIRNFIQFTGRT